MTPHDLECLLNQAARIDEMLPDKEKRMLNVQAAWPDYVYDADDRKDHEPEIRRIRPSASQLSLLDHAVIWINLLGLGIDQRTVTGKKIIWARACGFSYRQIAYVAGQPPSTCERWYKKDIALIAEKISD